MAEKKKNVVVRYDDSENIIESIIFTEQQTYGDAYRFRFMVELVKIAQETIHENFEHVLNGEKLRSGDYTYVELSFPLKNILHGWGDKNYEKAKRSLLNFENWFLVKEDAKGFQMQPVLSFAHMDRYSSVLRVEVRHNVWDSLLDFSKGFTEYNPLVILRLSSPFARQMYKGLRNQKGVVSYSVESLRKKFGYQGKYPRDNEFLRCVVDRARDELDRMADYSFMYDVVYDTDRPGRGRKSIQRVDFRSVRRVGNESDDAVVKMVHPSDVLGNAVYRVLTDKLFFTCAEVKNNIKLFSLSLEHFGEEGLEEWLRSIVPDACRARTSTQGYVVNALKTVLRNKYGVTYRKEEKGVVLGRGDVREVEPVREPVPGPGASKPGRKAGGGLSDGLDRNQYLIGSLFEGMGF